MQNQSREIPYSAFLAAKAACEKPADFDRFLKGGAKPAAWAPRIETLKPSSDDDDVVVMTIN